MRIKSSVDSNKYSISENVIKTIYTDEGERTITKTYSKYSIMNPADMRKYSVEETVNRIIHLTEEMASFWTNSKTWAPIEAANLLTKSRLDWQASLSKQLKLFLNKSNNESGLLILAWTTLGSLTEGILKLFLSVYYKVYQVQNLTREFKQVIDRKGNIIDPDGLILDKLRLFFAKRVFPANAKEVWLIKGEVDWLNWILKIQNRRNAIHAFKSRDIGDIEDFHSELQNFLIFLRKINNGLPYPDDIYVPAEHISDKTEQQVCLRIENERWIRGVIKKGKLRVASKEDGDFLKKHLKIKEEIEVVDEIFLPDQPF